jgi:hypothetical protein
VTALARLARRLASSALAGAATGARSFTGLAALVVATPPGATSQPDQAGSAASGVIIARREPDAVSTPAETAACASGGTRAPVVRPGAVD